MVPAEDKPLCKKGTNNVWKVVFYVVLLYEEYASLVENWSINPMACDIQFNFTITSWPIT